MPGVARVDDRKGDRHKPGTPKVRGIRGVDDELWEAVRARADADGYESTSEALVDLLAWYVSRPKSKKKLR